jgi:hypothetical protein
MVHLVAACPRLKYPATDVLEGKGRQGSDGCGGVDPDLVGRDGHELAEPGEQLILNPVVLPGPLDDTLGILRVTV